MAQSTGGGYPSDWDYLRRKVYRRDNYRCQNCGAKGGPKGDEELHAHHIVPKNNGGSDEVSNLTTVCKQCHNAIHGDSMAPTAESNTEGGSSWFPDHPLAAITGVVSGLVVLAIAFQIHEYSWVVILLIIIIARQYSKYRLDSMN